jgi:hypothetical protein
MPPQTKYCSFGQTEITNFCLRCRYHPHLPQPSALHNCACPCPLTSDRTRNARAPTSPRSTGFCVIWEGASSSSSFSFRCWFRLLMPLPPRALRSCREEVLVPVCALRPWCVFFACHFHGLITHAALVVLLRLIITHVVTSPVPAVGAQLMVISYCGAACCLLYCSLL